LHISLLTLEREEKIGQRPMAFSNAGKISDSSFIL